MMDAEASPTPSERKKMKLKPHRSTRAGLEQGAAAGGHRPGPSVEDGAGRPPETHILPATPHLMTTRLPFTSTLSRVSLLERDMFAASPTHSTPTRPAPLRRLRVLPQRRPRRHHPIRLAPPLPSTIGLCCPLCVSIGRVSCQSEDIPPLRGGAGTPAPVTSHTQPPLPEGVGSARGPVPEQQINGSAPFLRENYP